MNKSEQIYIVKDKKYKREADWRKKLNNCRGWKKWKDSKKGFTEDNLI